MKRILYIGNQLEKHGRNPTTADVLPKYLQLEGFSVKTVSSQKLKFFRLIDMLFTTYRSRKDVDYVMIDTYSTQNFWFAVGCGLLCKYLKIPYLFIFHGGNLDQRFANTSNAILSIFHSASHNIVPSPFLMKKLKRFNFSNIKLIPNSIEIELYDFQERKHLEPKLLWVRSLDEVSNPKMAIEVIKTLYANNNKAELCIVGPDKSNLSTYLRELAKTYEIPVKLMGRLKKEEWIQLSKDYHIFINTTRIDNTPVSVIEAMALGLPVISTDVGGIPFLINDRHNGILVESEDVKAMAGAVNELLKNPELTAELSQNGRKLAESFDWSKVKQEWLELLS